MDAGPNSPGKTTRATPPMAGSRDERLEQRLGHLAGELARLKAGPPLRRFLYGAAGVADQAP